MLLASLILATSALLNLTLFQEELLFEVVDSSEDYAHAESVLLSFVRPHTFDNDPVRQGFANLLARLQILPALGVQREAAGPNPQCLHDSHHGVLSLLSQHVHFEFLLRFLLS